MRRFVLLAVCVGSCLVAGRASAATYYISSSAGSDVWTAAQAQSRSTPWAHLPCMANATGNAAAYTPVAGDTFVLKGGDTWTNASFPCTVAQSGTPGNVITIGVDQTWFVGTSWVRPIWDAGGTAIRGPKNSFLNLMYRQYVTVSNIEIKGFYYSGAGSYGACAMIQGSGGQHLPPAPLSIP